MCVPLFFNVVIFFSKILHISYIITLDAIQSQTTPPTNHTPTVTLIKTYPLTPTMEVQILTGSVSIENLPAFLGKLANLSSANSVTVQGLDADMIAGEAHIRFAVKKALRAMEKHTNVANDLGIEIMRYAAGERQIGKALLIGLHEGENNAAFVIAGEPQSVSNAAGELKKIVTEKSLLDYSPSKRELIISHFNITEPEIEAVGEYKIPELVIERVALVDVLK
jgi:KEOPS complex subunit Cgi121